MAQIHLLDGSLDVCGPVDVLASTSPLCRGEVGPLLPDCGGWQSLFRQSFADRVHFVHDPHQIAAHCSAYLVVRPPSAQELCHLVHVSKYVLVCESAGGEFSIVDGGKGRGEIYYIRIL